MAASMSSLLLRERDPSLRGPLRSFTTRCRLAPRLTLGRYADLLPVHTNKKL
jgi:hypothetical protein